MRAAAEAIAKSPSRRATSWKLQPQPGPSTGARTETISSSSSSPVVKNPRWKSSARTVREAWPVVTS